MICTKLKQIGSVQNDWYSTKIFSTVRNNFGPIEGEGISVPQILLKLNFSFGNLFLRTNYVSRYLCKYLFRLREKTTSYQKCLERERIRCLSVHKALHKIMHTANHRLRFVFVSP